jgi:predicted SAM-dependent methyltransferase
LTRHPLGWLFALRRTWWRLWTRVVICPWIRATGYRRRRKVNLGSGHNPLPGYWNVDLCAEADLVLDLEHGMLPFPDASMDVVVCNSAINYFSRWRGRYLIQESYRILAKGGVARFSSQDLRAIAERYARNDHAFFDQTLPNGKSRFEGATMADKINTWFYGYATDGGKTGKYFYDYETLALLFREAGFATVECRPYRSSRLPEVAQIDNREDQVFFLEAVK